MEPGSLEMGLVVDEDLGLGVHGQGPQDAFRLMSLEGRWQLAVVSPAQG